MVECFNERMAGHAQRGESVSEMTLGFVEFTPAGEEQSIFCLISMDYEDLSNRSV